MFERVSTFRVCLSLFAWNVGILAVGGGYAIIIANIYLFMWLLIFVLRVVACLLEGTY